MSAVRNGMLKARADGLLPVAPTRASVLPASALRCGTQYRALGYVVMSSSFAAAVAVTQSVMGDRSGLCWWQTLGTPSLYLTSAAEWKSLAGSAGVTFA